MKITEINCESQNRLISTHISGLVDEKNTDAWQQSLEATLAKMGANSQFKIFVSLHGLKAANFKVHKKFRVSIPLTLAKYGWRVGCLDRFPEGQVDLESTRGIHYAGAVPMHEDETRMANCQTANRWPNEPYYTDSTQGEVWNRKYQNKNNSL